jgi:energy-coupling factor transport system ATP-binding protein
MKSGHEALVDTRPVPDSPPIEVDSLDFTYAGASVPALKDISLRIGAGEFVALAGANNAGKSTLCLALAGVVPHLLPGTMQGRVCMCGHDTAALNVAGMAAHIAFVMPKPEQQLSGVRFTVREEVAFGLENRGVERSEMLRLVREALHMTGLEAMADHSPHHLSGGQLQRLMLAAALACQTPVLVLDEPTTFLDPAGEKAVLGMLRGLCDAGRTIVLAGQRLDVVAGYADRVVALHGGRVVMDGPPRQVLASHLMPEIGLDWPRCTRVSMLARERGLWSREVSGLDVRERPPAITIEETLAGLAEAVALQAGPRRQPEEPVGFLDIRETGDAGIELENVRFRYGTGPEVLKGISLRIGGASRSGRGEAVALLGRNGSGKSTLVRHFNGLLKPAAGMVRVHGVATTKRRVAQFARQVALLFQNPDDQICKGTVLDEVAFGPRNLGFPADRVRDLTQNAISSMGLEGMEGQNPYDLGFSERKRLAVASVLSMGTGIVVLDEPTAGLDPRETALLKAAIRRLTDAGRSVVVISHDMDFVAENLDRAICLDEGVVRFDGPAEALFAEPCLLEECGLVPPQLVQLAAACRVDLEIFTPEGFLDRLAASRST